MACAPSEDSDRPGHPPSLIRVFAGRLMGSQGLTLSSSGQRRLWSDWADAQADLGLRWANMSFCWFCHDAAYLSIITPCCLAYFTYEPWREKTCLCHMRTTKTQISLRIRSRNKVYMSSMCFQIKACFQQLQVLTVNFLKFRTPEKIDVITQKFQQDGSNIE